MSSISLKDVEKILIPEDSDDIVEIVFKVKNSDGLPMIVYTDYNSTVIIKDGEVLVEN
jgi:hypothetical protein|tara:strand:+ start:546 stop:719 length:174 start_codon:yes stop_codon:yes gene_type:complete